MAADPAGVRARSTSSRSGSASNGRRAATPRSVSILVDGGASLAGLTVQVDDLEVIIPWATPMDLATWRLDLAGIGVGYEGGGITVAGGLRKLDRNGSADYLGMLRVTFVPYGLTAVGGYGVFPDGAGGEYVSFFGFGAVTAPIGGPPAFFVTGLGGGMGVNRRLIAPTIEQVHTFVLVQALDPFSSTWPRTRWARSTSSASRSRPSAERSGSPPG